MYVLVYTLVYALVKSIVADHHQEWTKKGIVEWGVLPFIIVIRSRKVYHMNHDHPTRSLGRRCLADCGAEEDHVPSWRHLASPYQGEHLLLRYGVADHRRFPSCI